MKKLLYTLSLVILVTVLSLSIPRILGLFLKDGIVINDSDLVLSTVKIPESENAFTNLNMISKGSASASKVINDIYDGKKIDNESVESVVLRNSENLRNFSAASLKQQYQAPSFSDPSLIDIEAVILNLNELRDVAKVNALKAINLADKGMSEEAIKIAIQNVRVGQKIMDSQIDLIGYLTGFSIHKIGLKTIQKITPSLNLPKDKFKSFIAEIESASVSRNGLTNAFKIEHLKSKQTLDLIVEPKNSSRILELLMRHSDSQREKIYTVLAWIDNSYYFQPNNTKNLSADYTRSQISKLISSCDTTDDEYERIAPKSSVSLYFTRNAAGKVWQDALGSSLDGVHEKICEEDKLLEEVKSNLMKRSMEVK